MCIKVPVPSFESKSPCVCVSKCLYLPLKIRAHVYQRYIFCLCFYDLRTVLTVVCFPHNVMIQLDIGKYCFNVLCPLIFKIAKDRTDNAEFLIKRFS